MGKKTKNPNKKFMIKYIIFVIILIIFTGVAIFFTIKKIYNKKS